MFLQFEHAIMHAMNWDDAQTFLAVARNGTFARAGRVLGVNATTIGRRLSTLESTLESKLFVRTKSGLSLSSTGRTLLPHTERMEAELLAAERALQGADSKTQGRVRLTASDGVTNYLIVPAISELRLKHPQLTIEIRSDARNLDLSRREVDIALRLSRPKEPSLVARRMGTLTFSLFGSIRYLAKKGTPRKIQDLRSHEFVIFDADVDLPQSRWLKSHVPELNTAISVNTTNAQSFACNAGVGLALLPNFVTTHFPELVQLLPRLDYPAREIWCVTHEDMRNNARVNCVVEWLRNVLQESTRG
jgi:DNA-binding transcriptional LysR family regulator